MARKPKIVREESEVRIYEGKAYTLLSYLTLIVVAVVCLGPLVWMLTTALKGRLDILSPVPKLLFTPTLENFYSAFVERDFAIYLQNSIIIALGTMVLCCAVGIPAAYGFSRYKIYGGKHWFFFILSTRMAPGVVIALPLYILLGKFQLLGTHPAVIIAHTTFICSFVIWLMKGFFDDIPVALENAAMVDGYSEAYVFFRILMPAVKPGVVVVSLFSFIYSWNEFLFAMILGGHEAKTLPAAFSGLVTPQGTYWGEICAAGVVVTLPIVFLTLFLQKYLVRGLSFGTVKG